MTNYRYRVGFAVPPVSAEIVGNELDRIHQKHGRLESKVVVDESRPEDAPMHAVFDWDDQSAAEKYRMRQAGNIIRAIVVIDKRQPENDAPAYVHIRHHNDTGKTGYQPVSVVAQRPDLYAMALAETAKYAKAAENSLNSLIKTVERLSGQIPQEDYQERMMRITLAVQAMQNANAAISAIH